MLTIFRIKFNHVFHSCVTDDSSKNVVCMDSVNTSHPPGPLMSTANNTQLGNSEVEYVETSSW